MGGGAAELGCSGGQTARRRRPGSAVAAHPRPSPLGGRRRRLEAGVARQRDHRRPVEPVGADGASATAPGPHGGPPGGHDSRRRRTAACWAGRPATLGGAPATHPSRGEESGGTPGRRSPGWERLCGPRRSQVLLQRTHVSHQRFAARGQLPICVTVRQAPLFVALSY